MPWQQYLASGSKDHFWGANCKKSLQVITAIIRPLTRKMDKEIVGIFFSANWAMFSLQLELWFPRAVRRCCSRNQLVLLLGDTAFVMLWERPKNHSFIITFVLEIELFVPRILSMKYRSK